MSVIEQKWAADYDGLIFTQDSHEVIGAFETPDISDHIVILHNEWVKDNIGIVNIRDQFRGKPR